MDRTEVSRHVAKVFAYLACGQRDKARHHAQLLIDWLRSI
jgi:hypothetical protein